MSCKTNTFPTQNSLQLDIFYHREHQPSQNNENMTQTGFSKLAKSGVSTFTKTSLSMKKEFSEHEPEFQKRIRSAALQEANKKCMLGYKWKTWDEFFGNCYAKSAHGTFKGGFTQVIRNFHGFDNTLRDNCTQCPKILNDAWVEMRYQEKNVSAFK